MSPDLKCNLTLNPFPIGRGEDPEVKMGNIFTFLNN